MAIYTNYNCNDYIDEARKFLASEGKELTYSDIYYTAERFCQEDWFDFYRPTLANYVEEHRLIVLSIYHDKPFSFSVIHSEKELYDLLGEFDYVEISKNESTLTLMCGNLNGDNYFYFKELTYEGNNYYLEHKYDDYKSLSEKLVEYSICPRIEF